MIDWHTHILPCIDDGAADLEQSVTMAALLSAAGFKEVYCTPHLIRGCHEASNSQVHQCVLQLQERLDGAGIPLKLRPGREYFLDEYLLAYLEDPLLLGDSRSVLIEIPSYTSADMVRQVMYRIVLNGLTPVIAHPERCSLLELASRQPVGSGVFASFRNLLNGGDRSADNNECSDTTGNALLDYLRDLGCSFQGNLGSFKGFYGKQVKAAAEAFACSRIYDRYGSDLHKPEQAAHVLH